MITTDSGLQYDDTHTGDGGMAALQALLGGAGGAGGARIDPAMLQRMMQGGMMRA